MCGIAGIFGYSNDQRLTQAIDAMTATLIHRGPDDSGIWVDKKANIAIGHRRLAILDLSQEGHQPMMSKDGRYVMAFNGEVYNHQALRKELENTFATPARTSEKGQLRSNNTSKLYQSGEKNLTWRGHSDTEVMLTAISAWGIEGALSKFIGMFAIALWDRLENKLHLMRDRMGEKPLYYGWCNKNFVFASELKALKKYPDFSNEIDRQALTLYFRHMAIPAPFTIYRNIYKLQPGCILSLGLDETSKIPDGFAPKVPASLKGLQLRQFWALHETAESGQASLISNERLALEMLEDQLCKSIRLQSVADVPLGVFLSGGVDSSLIAALMQSQASSPVQTFTIGFKEKQYNEAEYARTIANHLGTDHIELYVNGPDALDVIQQLPHLYDEPFADSSQIPTFLLCAQAKKHLTVALSGDAGDELFGGYNRYFWVRRIWSKISRVPLPARQLLSQIISIVPPHKWDKVYRVLCFLLPSSNKISFAGQKLHKLVNALKSIKDEDALYFDLVSQWKYPDQVVLSAPEPPTLLTQRNEWPKLPDIENRMMYLDAMTYMPNDILVKVDRASMGVSLETRAPFLDHRVVELAWRLPLNMKLRNGQGKWALRQILYKHVPQELIERPKQGFAVPLADWLRGPLREWAEDLLSEEGLQRDGYLNSGPIQLRWKEHLSGLRNWEESLWVVLMFQTWLRSNR